MRMEPFHQSTNYERQVSNGQGHLSSPTLDIQWQLEKTITCDMQTKCLIFHSLSQLRATRCSATPKPNRGRNLTEKTVVAGQRRRRRFLIRRTLTQINQTKPNPSYFNLTVTNSVTRTTKS